MANWEDIKGSITSLTNSLQSLPEDVRAKALQLLGQQLNSKGDNSESALTQSTVDVKSEITSNEICRIGLPNDAVKDAPIHENNFDANTLPAKRKRGRPSKSKDEAKSNIKEEPKSNIKDDATSTSMSENTKTPKTRSNRLKKKAKLSESEIKVTCRGRKKTEKSEDKTKITKEEISSDDKEHIEKLTTAETTAEDVCEMLDNSVINEVNLFLKSESPDEDDRPQPPKRGRPRKTGNKVKKEIRNLHWDFIPDNYAKNLNHKKNPVGRPRQNSLNGNTPKAKHFRCPECGKMLATKQSFREHQRQHTGEGFVCDCCGQRFTTNSGFLLHKRYHSDDPCVYKCTKCKYIVSNQRLLDDHYQLRHDPNRPKNHICDVCGKAFHGATQLEKHLFSHSSIKPYSCDLCDFSTAYPGGLEKHRNNVHAEERQLYSCELCGTVLKSKGIYMEHLGRHFNQRKKKCETCGKSFPNASQLAAHRRCHLEPMVPCNFCGKKLRSKHKLKVHELIHTGQKDFACPYCPYVTYVKHNLKKHCLARHKVDYPPLITPKMKKFKLNEVSSDGIKDPITLRCLKKLNVPSKQNPNIVLKNIQDEEEEEKEENEIGGAIATSQFDGITSAEMTSMASILCGTSAASDAFAMSCLSAVSDVPILPSMSVVSSTAAMSGSSVISNVAPVPIPLTVALTDSDNKSSSTSEKMYVTLSTLNNGTLFDLNSLNSQNSFFTTNIYLPTIITPTETTMTSAGLL